MSHVFHPLRFSSAMPRALATQYSPTFPRIQFSPRIGRNHVQNSLSLVDNFRSASVSWLTELLFDLLDNRFSPCCVALPVGAVYVPQFACTRSVDSHSQGRIPAVPLVLIANCAFERYGLFASGAARRIASRSPINPVLSASHSSSSFLIDETDFCVGIFELRTAVGTTQKHHFAKSSAS